MCLFRRNRKFREWTVGSSRLLMKFVLVSCFVLFCVNNILFWIRTNSDLRIKRPISFVQGFPDAAIFSNLKPDNSKNLYELCLATSWTKQFQKGPVHKVVIQNWAKISYHIKPVLFSLEENVRNAIWSPYWTVIPEVEFDLKNIPTLRGIMKEITSLFSSTLYGYSNGDIIFGNNFWDSIKSILMDRGLMTAPLLILGERINVKFEKNRTYTQTTITQIAKTGEFPVEGSSDIFITNKLFPWSKIPKIIVGRMGMGMWLVGYARARNITIIDVTNTSTLLHLTTNIGIHESGYAQNYRFNLELLNKLGYSAEHFQLGSLNCVPLNTKYSNDGKIIIAERGIPSSCFNDFLKTFRDTVED